jgi:hypothetical protein
VAAPSRSCNSALFDRSAQHSETFLAGVSLKTCRTILGDFPKMTDPSGSTFSKAKVGRSGLETSAAGRATGQKRRALRRGFTCAPKL